MKAAFAFLLLSLLLVAAPQKELLGKWSWVRSSGGFAGKVFSPETTSETRSLVVTKSKLCWFTNGELSNESLYTISTAKSIFNHREVEVLKVTDQPDLIFEIKGDTLSLSNNFPDGITQVFVRMR